MKSPYFSNLIATTTGAKTMSVTINNQTIALKLSASSYNNVTPYSPLNTLGYSLGSSGNPSASITTTISNDLIVATLHRHSTTTATTNRTNLFNDSVSQTLGASSYQISTSSGIYTDTYTGSANQNWAMLLASFKPATTSTPTGTTTTRYIHSDHLNSTNIVTDQAGTITETLDYFPYGQSRTDNKTSPYTGERRKYIGEEQDNLSNLNYLNARYLNATRGSFISEDPVFWENAKSQNLKNPQSLNSYSYREMGSATI
ncbi:MAG: hypothetical protein WAX44_00195 [Minisyncoccia bacterium]